MLKYAFIINMPEQTFSASYENAESFNLITGADITENTYAAKALVAKLAAEGYTLFNLCGDFDAEMAADFESVAEGIKVKASAYFDAEMEKMGGLSDEQMAEYGIIVKMAGVEETETVKLAHPAFNITTVFVKEMEEAKQAAKDLVADGIGFIELCSWFDADKTREMIAAVDGAVPFGSCGL